MMMIHGTKSRQAVVKALHNPREEVASVVGRTAANILMEISKQKQAVTKEPVPEDILQEAAGYVIPELITVGVAARIFPFDDHEGNGDSVGTGATKFDEIAKMAMLEATKVYGEAQLRAPGAEAKTEQAGNDWAGEVSREVQNGTASPDYMKLARPTQLIQEGK